MLQAACHRVHQQGAWGWHTVGSVESGLLWLERRGSHLGPLLPYWAGFLSGA
jgi:hypothetical protein